MRTRFYVGRTHHSSFNIFRKHLSATDGRRAPAGNQRGQCSRCSRRQVERELTCE